MKHKQFASDPPTRRFALVFDVDDDVLPVLLRFCEEQRILSGSLSAIGGFRRCKLAFYDLQTKRYEPVNVEEQVEVLSLLGNITEYEGKPKIHAHCIVSHRDGHTTGGHLLEGIVRPTLELLLEEFPSALRRTDRPEIGIPLIEV